VFTADVDARSSRLPRNVPNDALTPLSQLHVASKIFSRFANTLVTSVMENKSPNNKEAKFTVQLPQTAFISNFSMVVDGKLYIGVVKERNAAREEYEKAKNKSLNTGLVSQKPSESPVRGMDVFHISMNVAPNSSVEFRLNYQQLLERRKGYYEQVISVRPKQIVPILKVVIDIEEPQTLSYVDVMEIRKDPSDALVKDNPLAMKRETSPKSMHIEYSPSEDDQKKQGVGGVSGDFIVRYDVHHGSGAVSGAGVIQVLGSYFVHYFAPTGLKPLPKNVVFVIDVSGSMSGRNIKQTRDAMHAILGQLRAGDSFNIVLFNAHVTQWRSNASLVTNDNIQTAKTFVNNSVRAGGSTNINDALLQALKFLRNSANAGSVPLVLFLTDGLPTAGETNPSKIRTNILIANGIKASIFALGFGFSLDFDFLRALSAENGGIARRIYPDKDAAGQLEGFFDEISTPLLMHIRFEYPEDVVDDAKTTGVSFTQYYEGSELVVSGKLKEGSSSRIMSVDVRGDAGSNPVPAYSVSRTLLNLTVPSDKVLIKDFTERLWAYMKIKELLVKLLVSKDASEQAQLKAEALQMSLKYNFVTPLTSMVVVQSYGYLETGGELERNDIDGFAPSFGWKLSPDGLALLFILYFFVRFCAD